ncbi:MAG: isopentenyl-diphosphate Delta-isomerase, partial [Hyphomicrobiales bacterium]|nr:isopentenyl-diphosphate Delta-isomerase [Hyphomicrobiales bacterium]
MNDPSPTDLLVLVDENDTETGTMEKLEAHRKGALHRAISVFIFDGHGRTLLQKRHIGKYHSKGQWANAACSHPAPGELPFMAARRRLQEEMGFDCSLRFLFRIIYRHDVGEGLTEHELVHVFAGTYDGPVRPDPQEAEGYQWMAFEALVEDARKQPERYAPWLRIYL